MLTSFNSLFSFPLLPSLTPFLLSSPPFYASLYPFLFFPYAPSPTTSNQWIQVIIPKNLLTTLLMYLLPHKVLHLLTEDLVQHG